MPQVEHGPKHLNHILESAYSSAIAQGKDKGTASAIAWSAAKNKYKKHGENWVRKLYDDLNIVILASQKVVNESQKHNLAKNVDYLLFAVDKMSKFLEEESLGKIDDVDDGIEWLIIDDTLVNPYNRQVDKNKVDGIKQKIKETNKVKPVVYSEVDKDGKKANMITDGHHRYVALKELGYKEIPAKISDENGTDTTADDDNVELKKEITTTDVAGLDLTRQDLQGKARKPRRRINEDGEITKGGPGSGCTVESGNCGRPSTGGSSEKLPPHLQSVVDRQRGFGVQDVTPAGYGPDKPEAPKNNWLESKTHKTAFQSANDYAKRSGLAEIKQTEPVKVDPEHGRKIAEAYDKMESNPNDPKVKSAYDALGKEVNEQYKSLPIKVEFTKDDPYKTSEEMRNDIEQNGRLKVFTGGEEHPLLGKKDESGISLNDKFRAVHDYYGHAMMGHKFGPSGEENAWMEHSKMFSPEAQKALTTETRGQNSWYNWSKENEGKQPGERKFAPNKVGILPDEFLSESARTKTTEPEGMMDRKPDEGHFGNKPIVNRGSVRRELGEHGHEGHGGHGGGEGKKKKEEQDFVNQQIEDEQIKEGKKQEQEKQKEVGITTKKFEKGGPGSGRNPENPIGRTDDLDSQIEAHKADFRTGKIKLEAYKKRVEPLYALKQRTGNFSGQTMKPIIAPFGINKGGQGSGCQGVNCGRPSTGNKAFDEPIHSGNHIKEFLKNNDVVIATTDKEGLSQDKKDLRNKELEDYLDEKQIPYKKGSSNFGEWGNEKAYIIHAPTPEDSEKLQDMFHKKYKQDAVLTVRNGHAVGHYQDGRKIHGNTDKLEAGDHITDNYFNIDGVKFRLNMK